MPYIERKQREAIDPHIAALVEAIKRETIYKGTAFRQVEADGAANYAVTRIILDLMLPGDRPSYTKLGKAVMCLEMCKLELYRRAAAPYEDKKSAENGDVYL